ncbi:hypothetical protein BS17DRAFT_883307 [Gyrodon lividus]|nr:hypothetical protein BS17DRAFT_883307 [Gyrodon lividus]
MQFKLATAFILTRAVLAAVNAAPTAFAPSGGDPAVNPDFGFAYVGRAEPETTDMEAVNPDFGFAYVGRAGPETTDAEAVNPDFGFAYVGRAEPETVNVEALNPDLI